MRTILIESWVEFPDFRVDFWISQWISGFQLGFLDFSLDFCRQCTRFFSWRTPRFPVMPSTTGEVLEMLACLSMVQQITDYHAYRRYTEYLYPYYGPAMVVLYISITLMIVVLLLPSCYWQNGAEYIIIIHLIKGFSFQHFQNLWEDNLSTRDNWPVPNVSFTWRFCCSLLSLP